MGRAMESDAKDGVAANNDYTDCERDREPKKTGIDDILVDYFHDYFQDYLRFMELSVGEHLLSPEPSISVRESCRIQTVLNYCRGQVGENLKHYL